ncbi:hypothetical protein ERS044006_02507, partial [Streptococcus pneumoniae]
MNFFWVANFNLKFGNFFSSSVPTATYHSPYGIR